MISEFGENGTICFIFFQAIESNEGVDRPDIETQLKIMQWMVGEPPEITVCFPTANRH